MGFDFMEINELCLTKKETVLMKLIARVGFYVEPFKNQLGISDKIVYNCMSKGLIKDYSPQLVFGTLLRAYSLTDKGKYLIKGFYGINPYISKIRQLEHDYLLGKIYLSLSGKEQETWKTELYLMNKYPGESVVDGIYIDENNNIVGVEVITEYYSDNEIDNKITFIKKYCDKDIIIRTKDILKKGR